MKYNVCVTLLSFLTFSCSEKVNSPKRVVPGKYKMFLPTADLVDVINLHENNEWYHEVISRGEVIFSEKGNWTSSNYPNHEINVNFGYFTFMYNSLVLSSRAHLVDKTKMYGVSMNCYYDDKGNFLDLDEELGYIYRMEK